MIGLYIGAFAGSPYGKYNVYSKDFSLFSSHTVEFFRPSSFSTARRSLEEADQDYSSVTYDVQRTPHLDAAEAVMGLLMDFHNQAFYENGITVYKDRPLDIENVRRYFEMRESDYGFSFKGHSELLLSAVAPLGAYPFDDPGMDAFLKDYFSDEVTAGREPMPLDAVSSKVLDAFSYVSAYVTDDRAAVDAARAYVLAMSLARRGYGLSEIDDFLGYYFPQIDLSKDITTIRSEANDKHYTEDHNIVIDFKRDSYKVNSDPVRTVSCAIVSALVGEGFEDSLKLAISMGGDTPAVALAAGALSDIVSDSKGELMNEALVSKAVDLAGRDVDVFGFDDLCRPSYRKEMTKMDDSLRAALMEKFGAANVKFSEGRKQDGEDGARKFEYTESVGTREYEFRQKVRKAFRSRSGKVYFRDVYEVVKDRSVEDKKHTSQEQVVCLYDSMKRPHIYVDDPGSSMADVLRERYGEDSVLQKDRKVFVYNYRNIPPELFDVVTGRSSGVKQMTVSNPRVKGSEPVKYFFVDADRSDVREGLSRQYGSNRVFTLEEFASIQKSYEANCEKWGVKDTDMYLYDGHFEDLPKEFRRGAVVDIKDLKVSLVDNVSLDYARMRREYFQPDTRLVVGNQPEMVYRYFDGKELVSSSLMEGEKEDMAYREKRRALFTELKTVALEVSDEFNRRMFGQDISKELFENNSHLVFGSYADPLHPHEAKSAKYIEVLSDSIRLMEGAYCIGSVSVSGVNGWLEVNKFVDKGESYEISPLVDLGANKYAPDYFRQVLMETVCDEFTQTLDEIEEERRKEEDSIGSPYEYYGRRSNIENANNVMARSQDPSISLEMMTGMKEVASTKKSKGKGRESADGNKPRRKSNKVK